MQLKLLSGSYSFRQYESTVNFDHSIIETTSFIHIAKTDHELSIFGPSDLPLVDYKKRTDNRVVLELVGEFEFNDANVGITAKLSSILAEQGISLCFVGTFGTDYILVFEKDLENAIDAFTNAGVTIL